MTCRNPLIASFPATLLFLLLPGFSGVLMAADPVFAKVPKPVALQAPAAKETSGLAASVRSGDAIWLVNDSGGTATLYLAGIDGSDRGAIQVEGTTNLDWEDLAGFSWRGNPYLLIADVGDNGARRASCKLYIVPEPPPPPAGGRLNGAVKPAWTIEFRYPDGPRDCEAVAVDPTSNKVILLSKRTTPPIVYELPLQPNMGGVVVARRIGQTDVSPPPGGFPHPFGAQPTALDFSPDGTMAAVLTYVGVFVFPKKPNDSWAAVFARKPVILPRHGLVQAEAIAFSRNGRSLWVASEGVRSPLVAYRRQRDAADPHPARNLTPETPTLHPPATRQNH